MTFILHRDFLVEVRKGNIEKHSVVHKFGRNDAVPNGSWEFINLLGFSAWPLSAPTLVKIKAGGNAGDTALGAGAREITVEGIGAALTEVSDVMATAGAGVGTLTTLTFWRVHRAYVSPLKCGTYGGSNIGDVIVVPQSGSPDLIKIAATEGQSQFTAFSIPTGKTGYLLSVNVTVDALKPADIRLMTRENLNNTTAPVSPVRLKKNWDGVRGAMPPYEPRSPDVIFSALTDVWMEARGSGAATEVSATMEILLVDD